ncbi:hypothetical protein ACROYT_G034730 [Oculina patagonica]
MDKSPKIYTDEVQFPSDPTELENSQSCDQPIPGSDAKSCYIDSSSPPSSPLYQLHLLPLSSDSNDCFEALSPVSLCDIEFVITDENQIKEHQTKVSSDSGIGLKSEFMIKMDSVSGEITAATSGQDDYNHVTWDQPTGQLIGQERNSAKDTGVSRRDSTQKAKQQSGSESPTTHQNNVASHFVIPSRSHLALRRKLKVQASQHPLPAKSSEENAPVSLKSQRKSDMINQSSRGSKISKNAPIQGGLFVYPEIPRVPRPPTRKCRVGPGFTRKARKQETPSLKGGQSETSTHEKYGENFQERNRKATIPFLPNISPAPNHLSFPASQKSPRKSRSKSRRKSRKLSELFRKSKRTSQEKHKEPSPETNSSVPVQSRPRICKPRQRRQSRDQLGSSFCTSEKACVEAIQGSSFSIQNSSGETSILDLNAIQSVSVDPPTTHLAQRRKLKRVTFNPSPAKSQDENKILNSIEKGHEPGKSIHCQTNTSTSHEEHKKTPQEVNSSIPSSPKICQPRQRDHVINHRVINHMINRMSAGETSVVEPNALPSHSVIPPTSHLALRRKLTRGTSNKLPDESREESMKPKGITAETTRLLSRPTIRSIRLNGPVPQNSSDLTRCKIKPSNNSPKTPKSAPIQGRHFVYPEIPRVPHPPTRKTLVRPSTTTEGHKHEKSLLKDDQSVTSSPENQGETSEEKNSSVPFLPKIPNVQPAKQDGRKQRVKTLLDICNSLSNKQRTL